MFISITMFIAQTRFVAMSTQLIHSSVYTTVLIRRGSETNHANQRRALRKVTCTRLADRYHSHMPNKLNEPNKLLTNYHNWLVE